MEPSGPYRGLNFERRRRSVPGRLTAVGTALASFILLWVAVPHAFLFWLLLVSGGVLVWVASYGWREALAALHDLLHALGDVEEGD